MTPFSQWLVLLCVTLFSMIGTHKRKLNIGSNDTLIALVPNNILLICSLVLMIYYGANSIMNDVYVYRNNFSILTTELNFKDLFRNGLGDNPGFTALSIFIKNYISDSPDWLQIVVCVIAQTGFILFFRRYSSSVALSLLFFITSGLYTFSIVSFKQSMAMAIGVSLTPLIQKNKIILYLGLLAATSLIHPYILMYAVFPFILSSHVWSRRNILIMAAMLICGLLMTKIMGTALELTETVFGDKHDAQYFTGEYGIKIERVIFYAITPVLSIIYRKRIDSISSKMLNGFIQMSAISFGFMVMAMTGSGFFIGRMGQYFEPFTYVALPIILLNVVPKNIRKVLIISICALYIVFYSFLHLKYGSLFSF